MIWAIWAMELTAIALTGAACTFGALAWRNRRRAARQPQPYPKRMLVIPGPKITADDWDGGHLKPGVMDRFEGELEALVDRLRSL